MIALQGATDKGQSFAHNTEGFQRQTVAKFIVSEIQNVDDLDERMVGKVVDSDPSPVGTKLHSDDSVLRALFSRAGEYPPIHLHLLGLKKWGERASGKMRSRLLYALPIPPASYDLDFGSNWPIPVEEKFEVPSPDGVNEILRCDAALSPFLLKLSLKLKKYFPLSALVLNTTRNEEDEGKRLSISVKTDLEPSVAVGRLDSFDFEWWLSQPASVRSKIVVIIEYQ